MNADSFDDPELLNFDLYLNYAVPPGDGVEIDCVREGLGNYAACEIRNPTPGTWYAKVNAAANLFSTQYGLPVAYQVTASSFRTREYAGVVDAQLVPQASASWPGGVVPHTLRVQNKTDRSLRTTLTFSVYPPSGLRYVMRRSGVSLGAGEVREIPVPVPVPLTAELGQWMVIAESNASGQIDKSWNTFEVQLDRAADVALTTPEPMIFEGEDWDYTSTIAIVSGLAKVAEAVWQLVDPAGAVTTWSRSIPLAPGQTWTESATLDALTTIGTYTLTLATTIDRYVDRASIRFDVVPIGRAKLTLIEGAGSAVAITPDGRVIVGNVDTIAGDWSYPYRFRTDTGDLTIIGSSRETAVDVSDDGAVVVGQAYNPETGLSSASIWDLLTQEWRSLGTLGGGQGCGADDTTVYALSGDGSTAVGLAYSDPCDAFAFRWTEETGMEPLPRFADSWASRANDVNYDGNVIIGWEGWEVFGNRRASRWTAVDPDSASDYQGELLGSFLPEEPINGPGESLAVSSNGVWIAGEGLGDISRAYAGFVWSEQTGLIPFPNTTRGWSIYPFAVSDDGRTVIGTTGPFWAPGFRQAFIWTAEGGTKLLADWMVQLGADLSAVGGVLNFAMGMTADGGTIVGTNWSIFGSQAWIAELPTAGPPTATPAAPMPADPTAEEPATPIVPAPKPARVLMSK
jgi:hypothetical protein